MLTVNGCRKYGIKGMVALIRAGDVALSDLIVHRRCVCRKCPDRIRKGGMDICRRDQTALHFRTAVGSYTCPEWDAGSPS